MTRIERVTRPIVGWSLLVIVMAAGMTAACGRGPAVASGDLDAFEVSSTQLFVTVSNRTGSGLLDVRVEIEPVGKATVFSSSYPRMEPGERKNFPLQEFRGDDGTPFNLRVHRPRMIKVSGHTQTGEDYALQTPWE